MEKIKVLHVVHNFLRGGIESFLYYTVKQQLSNQGLDVAILCCSSKNNVVNHRIESLGIKIFYIDVSPFEYRLRTLNKIVKICNNYDIIHFQVFIPTVCIYVQMKSNSKIIHTVHSAGYVLRNHSLLEIIKNQLFVLCLNKSAGIAHNSPFTKTFWEKRGLKERDTNVFIYNGVNFSSSKISEEPYQSMPDLREHFIIGTTSRLIPWKRVNLLIEAYKNALPNLPQNVLLLIVGEGEEINKLKSLYDNVLHKKIRFIGYKSNITDYQSIMDLCIFPSVEEPFGLVSIECLHLGKRVIVMNDGGGLTDIIKGYNPHYVARNFEDLVYKIISCSKLKIDGKEKERIEYSKQFSVEIEEKQYFNFYKKVIQ